jgi:peptide deformylase
VQLKILQDDDPGLRGTSEDVKEVTDDLNELALNMMETMTIHQGIGLAAPQVGKKINLLVFDTSFSEDDGKMAIMFNPKIMHGEGNITTAEKCLSFPGRKIKVKRYRKVRVKYLNTQNEKCIVDLEGLAAIVVQHEIDHLEGILLSDYERH